MDLPASRRAARPRALVEHAAARRETADIIGKSVTRSAVKRVSVLREGMYSKVKGYEVPASEREEAASAPMRL